MRPRLLEDSLRTFLGEGLVLPTGLIIAAFLARRFGPEDYGLFSLGASAISLVEVTIAALLSQATILLVSQARDSGPVATTASRLHIGAGVGAAASLFALATPTAALLEAPALVWYLRLFALELVFFSLASALRSVLIGKGEFGRHALTGAARWTTKLVLIVALVEAGLSVYGAILGSVMAAGAQLVASLYFVRVPLARPASPIVKRRFVGVMLPVLASGLLLKVFDRLDLFALTALTGSAEQAGFYAAAQNIAFGLLLLGLTLAPVLLSHLGRELAVNDAEGARKTAQSALRLVLNLLPFAALASGAADEICVWVFGEKFQPAGPILSVLALSCWGRVMGAVTTSILIATGRARWTVALATPLLPLGLAGHLYLIPRLAAAGAAFVTALGAGLFALAGAVAVHRAWGVSLPTISLLRAGLMAALAFYAGSLWPAAGVWLIVKLLGLSLAIGAALRWTGELEPSDLQVFRWLLERRSREAEVEGSARR